MCAKKKVDEDQTGDDDLQILEEFMDAYVSSYRSIISDRDMDERHLPQFYKGFPFVTEIFRLPNGAVCALFKKSNRSKLIAQEGMYEDIKIKMDERTFDFMQVFPPYTGFNDEEAERLAHVDVERDLRASRQLEILSDTELHLNEVHNEMQGVLDLNPWLDEQTGSQREKLDKAKLLLQELYKEMEMDEEERFADYARQFMEIMAFEKIEVEEVTGELEVQMETTFDELEQRMDGLETRLEDSGGGDNAAVEELSDQFIDVDKGYKELRLRVDSLEASEGMGDEVDSALRKVRESLKETKSKMTVIKKDMVGMQKELTISKEIRDTVFRDSKRAHNLNERITDMEKDIAALKRGADKGTKSQMKALEGKMNVMEKNLKDYMKDVVDKEVSRSLAAMRVESLPPPPDMQAPKGATVKKTTKKKTTKKTKRRN